LEALLEWRLGSGIWMNMKNADPFRSHDGVAFLHQNSKF
jgi:hypothetical protein